MQSQINSVILHLKMEEDSSKNKNESHLIRAHQILALIEIYK